MNLRSGACPPSTTVGRAGIPTITAPSGTSRVTTALAPIRARAPTAIGPMTCAPEPMMTLSPMVGWRLPGLIDTPIYGEGPESEAFKAKLGESVLFPHRLGVADELASMVVELATNSYMNAEVVRVDGGIRMPPK